MRPSEVLNQYRQTIREIVQQYRIRNPRILGSVVHGTDTEDSDLDLLIDPLPQTTLFDLGSLQDELSCKLRIEVDVRTHKNLPETFCQQVLVEAQPL